MKEKDRQGWMLIGGVALVFVVIFGVRQYFMGAAKPDPVTNCLGAPIRNTVILIDHTDPLAKQTRDEIVHRSISYINSDKVALNERVSVFTVSELSKQNLQPLFSKCKPEKERNRLTEAASAGKRFIDNFEKPIVAVLNGATDTSNESPIAQSIIDLSLKDELSGEKNTLIVFSDMAENTNKFSLLKCSSPDRVVADYQKSVLGSTERPTFKTTTIFINQNPPSPSAGAVTKTIIQCTNTFWTWFFEDVSHQNSSIHFEPMP